MPKAFEAIPLMERGGKPRTNGITFVIDRGGTSLRQWEDLLARFADYVDYVKLQSTLTRLQDRNLVKEQVSMFKEHNVSVFPGGALFEFAAIHDRVPEYFDEAKDLGFDTVELSVTSFLDVLPLEVHAECVRVASQEYGFKTFAEVGRKEARGGGITLKETVRRARALLGAGALKIGVDTHELEHLIESGGDGGGLLLDLASEVGYENLIFEGMTVSLQGWFVSHFGPDVNLGNVEVGGLAVCELIRRSAYWKVPPGRLANPRTKR